MDDYFDNIHLNKALLCVFFDPICLRYELTLTELFVLLHLRRNTQHNTATDIVHRLRVAKSYISLSVRRLEERGFVEGYYTQSNHRSIHLRLCVKAQEIVEAAEHAQHALLEVALRGFTPQEIASLQTALQRIAENTNAFLHPAGNHI